MFATSIMLLPDYIDSKLQETRSISNNYADKNGKLIFDIDDYYVEWPKDNILLLTFAINNISKAPMFINKKLVTVSLGWEVSKPISGFLGGGTATPKGFF